MIYFRTIILTLIFTIPLIGNEKPSTAPKFGVLKSAVIPGWGEHSYQSKTRAYIFNGIEASLWIFAGVASSTIRSHESDLYYLAAEYAEVTDPQSKSDIFLDRVSSYESMDAYNEQMLRNRQWDRIYSREEGEYWNWETTERRKEYYDIKTQRYYWRQRLTYTFGALALNHLVSTMDALFLKRQQSSLTVQPIIGLNNTGMLLSLSF
ncbi:MAG: hypothetical protein K9N35_00020 [Candidatus Marinimicrobia bacterium]|nr:hypothetical protein [Candidatus Neomarinimicrobiota bacterium]